MLISYTINNTIIVIPSYWLNRRCHLIKANNGHLYHPIVYQNNKHWLSLPKEIEPLYSVNLNIVNERTGNNYTRKFFI